MNFRNLHVPIEDVAKKQGSFVKEVQSRLKLSVCGSVLVQPPQEGSIRTDPGGLLQRHSENSSLFRFVLDENPVVMNPVFSKFVHVWSQFVEALHTFQV